MADLERIRLVILGGAGVGKSCIVKRFLFKTYSDKYRATVEDLYNREYDLGSTSNIKVDILDTSGDMQFPAMRRLSVATAHAFLLVYATTSAPSFSCIKQCFEEIREQRPDYQDIPIVIAGNKTDLAFTHREVKIEDVSEWVFCELPKLRIKVLECSAKDGHNVNELFKTMLSLSRFSQVGNADSSTGLKRRSSAYVSATSKGSKTALGRSMSVNRKTIPKSLRGKSRASSSSLTADLSANSCLDAGSDGESRFKPRSRSLIRRSSRKTKQQIQNASNGEECNVQ